MRECTHTHTNTLAVIFHWGSGTPCSLRKRWQTENERKKKRTERGDGQRVDLKMEVVKENDRTDRDWRWERGGQTGGEDGELNVTEGRRTTA